PYTTLFRSSMGGFAPGGVDHGHQEDSTHYDGRAIDIFFRPVSEENRREGWQLAHWLIAHADDLDIQYVISDDLGWSAHSFGGQWHDYEVEIGRASCRKEGRCGRGMHLEVKSRQA